MVYEFQVVASMGNSKEAGQSVNSAHNIDAQGHNLGPEERQLPLSQVPDRKLTLTVKNILSYTLKKE